MTRGRWVALVVVLLAAVFALAGGEYGVQDLRQLRAAERAEADSVAALATVVDSLERDLTAVLTDPDVQERIAREQFGMLRDGEFGYQIRRPVADSGSP